jgi:hypothetical protein
VTGRKRVYLHIGLHKTGTTYLQNFCRANREGLAAQAVDFPGGPGQPSQVLAVWDVQGRRPRDVEDPRIAGQWSALVRNVNASSHPMVLISEERLSVSSARQAQKVVDAFAEHEVHIVVTARDIGRIAVSAWQEALKNESKYTWAEFSAAIKDPDLAAKNPARSFWLRQDLAKICEMWESTVSADRLHIVTVPPPGSRPGLLLERYASVVGFDPARLTEQPAWSNETIGAALGEVLRRMNERMAGRLNQRQYDRVVKHVLVPRMVARSEQGRFSLPDDDMPWAIAHAQETVETLKARGYPVAGDLADLVPSPRPDLRRPDDASDDEIVDTALDALTCLAESYGTAWWARRKPDDEIAGRGDRVGYRARGIAFRLQQRAGRVADRNRLARRALRLGMRIRNRGGR